MARISNIASNNSKKLDITKFFSNALIDNDESVYIFIKKLSFSTKKKIDLLSINTFNSKMGKVMFKKLEEKKIDTDKIQNDQQLIMSVISDLDLSEDDIDKMNDTTINLAEIILNEGVDPKNHNIEDDKGEKITVNYDFFNEYCNEETINYIMNEIKELSKGYSLGK